MKHTAMERRKINFCLFHSLVLSRNIHFCAWRTAGVCLRWNSNSSERGIKDNIWIMGLNFKRFVSLSYNVRRKLNWIVHKSTKTIFRWENVFYVERCGAINRVQFSWNANANSLESRETIYEISQTLYDVTAWCSWKFMQDLKRNLVRFTCETKKGEIFSTYSFMGDHWLVMEDFFQFIFKRFKIEHFKRIKLNDEVWLPHDWIRSEFKNVLTSYVDWRKFWWISWAFQL